MTLWMVRVGRHGEHEQQFLSNDRAYLTWGGASASLKEVSDPKDVAQYLQRIQPHDSDAKRRSHVSQIWAFVKRMKTGDWVLIPSKAKPAIHVAEVTGAYHFDANAVDPYYHSRQLKWIARDVPRSVFDQDLLYSLGAIMTICEISRNDAEARVRAMAAKGWQSNGKTDPLPKPDGGEGEELRDLEEYSRDQIAKLIIRKFKGHRLEELVEAILKAQGYTTYHSPVGPDKGIDILAAPGPLGFGHPRICVQVKSSESPVDAPTLNQLIGAMQNVHADQGLLVSWGGFKASVDRDVAAQFFRVRLWDQKTLIEQLLAHYDDLDADVRADIPLKRMWALAHSDEE